MTLDFKHSQAAHCENGVTSNLLRYYGVDVSEAVIFGISSGLFFAYLPFLKVNGLPITSFRPLPGMIFQRTATNLGIKVYRKKFRNKEDSMAALDKALDAGIPVGLQVGVFNLTYFPKPYRFHFNAHNIVVFGKENGHYIISDPVMETVESLSYEELLRVRWARGALEPKGQMYYPLKVPAKIDVAPAIRKGIKKNCRDMLTIPVPLFGIKGIRYLSKKIKKWPEQLGDNKAALYLGQLIRMQEEVGTGGAGFRFIYAAFLQEAAAILHNNRLLDISQAMTDTGDRWRDFAVIAGRIIKKRSGEGESYAILSNILAEIAERERAVFSELKKFIP
ncbi:MAG: BtrH N-terminal domain-containing protein [Deltaproteobacteria bacterium]|nr:BtrH N-terminal domain-containing protein [Deltaproteobacteria bacterium]